MKKLFAFCLLLVLSLTAFACSFPDNKTKVADIYEMESISGSIGGITITKDTYEYFTMLFNEDGTDTVRTNPRTIGNIHLFRWKNCFHGNQRLYPCDGRIYLY